MAEAPQQQQQHQQEEEEEEQPTSVEATDTDEGSEEPKDSVQVTPTRPLLSMRSMSTVDPDDDLPNMIVYRKVRAKTKRCSISQAGLLLNSVGNALLQSLSCRASCQQKAPAWSVPTAQK